MKSKLNRLHERIEELNKLNKDIAFLAFYLNENPKIDEKETWQIAQLDEQLKFMIEYRNVLQLRIERGNF